MLCAILLIEGSYLINGVSLGLEYLHSVNYCGEELKLLNRSLIKKLLYMYLSNSKVQEGVKAYFPQFQLLYHPVWLQPLPLHYHHVLVSSLQ